MKKPIIREIKKQNFTFEYKFVENTGVGMIKL